MHTATANTDSAPFFSYLPHAVVLVFAIYLCTGKMANEIWYDEAYTLEHFATGNLSDAFCKYISPNNHVVFSAVLGQWFAFLGRQVDSFTLRLFPLVAFLISIIILFNASSKVSGTYFGFFTAILFASNHVVQNFCTQLRGYGPTWLPICLALWAFVMLQEKYSRKWLFVLGISLFIGAGIVPTNIITCGIISCSAFMAWITCRNKQNLYTMLTATISPIAGVIFYSGVLTQLLDTSSNFKSGFMPMEAYTDWFVYTLQDLWWVLPLALIGIVSVIRTYKKTEDNEHKKRRHLALILTVSSVAIPAAALLLMPNAPFPRTLVPAIPLLLFSIAHLAYFGIQTFETKINERTALILLILITAGVGTYNENNNAGYTTRHQIGDRPQNIYDLYFTQAFYPSKAIIETHKISEQKNTIVLTDRSDVYAIKRAKTLLKTEKKMQYMLIDNASPKLRENVIKSRNTLIVLITRNLESATLICKNAGLTGHPILKADTGFFKVYTVGYASSQR